MMIGPFEPGSFPQCPKCGEVPKKTLWGWGSNSHTRISENELIYCDSCGRRSRKKEWEKNSFMKEVAI